MHQNSALQLRSRFRHHRRPVRNFSIRVPFGDTLYLFVTPAGGRYWRSRYRIHGTQKTSSLGVYPDIPLALTRKRYKKAMTLLAQDIDPNTRKTEIRLGRRNPLSM